MLTINQTQKMNTQSDLKQSLSQFGLCPFDWTVEVKDDRHAIIQNIEEADFKFIGKLKPTNNTWEYLKLYSL